jgi:hypothetical protein
MIIDRVLWLYFDGFLVLFYGLLVLFVRIISSSKVSVVGGNVGVDFDGLGDELNLLSMVS